MAGFTAKEIAAELARRDRANRRRDNPISFEPEVGGSECLHCGQPVGSDGNSEFALCSNCLHDD